MKKKKINFEPKFIKDKKKVIGVLLDLDAYESIIEKIKKLKKLVKQK